MSNREGDFDSNGVPIHYVAEGRGELVLLLHGFIFSMGPAWLAGSLFETLRQRHQVIALDLRGHGKSGKPHDPKRYGLAMVHDALRLMDHLRLDRCHVVGYSLGGILACKLSDIASDRLRSMVVGGAVPVYSGDDTHRNWKPLAEMLERVRPGEPLSSHFWPDPSSRPPRFVQDIVDANDPAALAAVARGMLDVTVTQETLRDNRVPTLVICGEQDPIAAGIAALKRVMRNLSVRIVPGVDHHTLPGSKAFEQEASAFIARSSVPA